nr:immunoglobulin heavy chain junction region [Mus musculus]MBK4188915.1 immunoglobulin heavy chain junction region [Mus musculus]
CARSYGYDGEAYFDYW